ncbi:hypothetical protein Lser_V15G06223 [Lactuca serriola]
MFQKIILEDDVVKVTNISEKQENKGCISGLNIVNFLKELQTRLLQVH